MDKLISVIVPVYNVRAYLEECVESLLGQTYGNLEIILVDDGSTDGSSDICDKYAELDARVKVVHQKNAGVSAARNAGLDIAQGSYLGFVDSDDWIKDTMYETLCDALTEADADMCICSYVRVDGQEKTMSAKCPMKNEVLTPDEAQKKLGLYLGWYYVLPVTKLYRRELFQAIRFSVGMRHEDEEIIHKLFDQCKRIVTLDEGLYFYRRCENGFMNARPSIKRLDGVEAIYNRFVYYQNTGRGNLLSDTYSRARKQYEIMKDIRVKTKSDRERVREVKRMFKYMLDNTQGNKIKEYVVLLAPKAYFTLHDLYKKCKN